MKRPKTNRCQTGAPFRAQACAHGFRFAVYSVLLGVLLAASFGCRKEPEPLRQEVRRRSVTFKKADPGVESSSRTELALADDSGDAAKIEKVSENGLIYRNDVFPDVPWSVSLLKIDRSRPDLQLTTTLGGRRQTIGLGCLTEQIESIPHESGAAVAAINGDFYRTEHESYSGDPRGLQILRSELISGPNGKTCFWLDTNGAPVIGNVAPKFRFTLPSGTSIPFGLNEERRGNEAVLYTPRIGRSTGTSGGREFILVAAGEGTLVPLRIGQVCKAQVREIKEGGNSRLSPDILVLSLGPSLAAKVGKIAPGAVLQISTETIPDLNGVTLALGGGPPLVHEGKVQPANASKSRDRHPRSGFGWNDKYYYFVQVDGRQHGFSVGMTLPELAAYMKREGCEEAITLDGGGSSEMWVEGQIVNRPCFGRERETGNGLAVLKIPLAAGR